ncbi:hypothetical protein EV175_003595, partial [Coemansia sp. RSA 1933]
GNPCLHKGVLVGVFDVRGVGLGSGLNNVVSYVAHTGLGGAHCGSNPFQLAFGFTAQDMWALIKHYTGSQWQHRQAHSDAEIERFKRDLLVGCLRYFDGYRIGQIHHVFNPHAVLTFLNGIRSIKSPSAVQYSGRSHWVETGSVKVLESVRTGGVNELHRYCNYLSEAFLQQSSYQLGVKGPLVDLMKLDQVSDEAVEVIESQEQSGSLDVDSANTCAELVDICIGRSGETFHDMKNLGHDPLSVETVIRLLYQAGYLVPVSHDRVGIPNFEVLGALSRFYEKVAKQHNVSKTLNDSTFAEMGIRDMDISRLARSVNKRFIRLTGLAEITLEATYQNLMLNYLYPATTNGYDTHSEVDMGNGRADILVYPSAGPSHTDNDSCYYMLELKRYEGRTQRLNSERMSMSHRRHVAGVAYDRAILAQQQIRERYFQMASEKARGFRYIFVIGMTLWVNRFCMVATRYKRYDNSNGSISWRVERYPGGIDVDGAASYDDIEDEIGSTDNDCVRERVVQGSLVFLTI